MCIVILFLCKLYSCLAIWLILGKFKAKALTFFPFLDVISNTQTTEYSWETQNIRVSILFCKVNASLLWNWCEIKQIYFSIYTWIHNVSYLLSQQILPHINVYINTEWSALLTHTSSIADVWELINYLTAIVTYSPSPSRPGLLNALFNWYRLWTSQSMTK